MKRYSKLLVLMIPLIGAVFLNNCILEEKIIDFVINEKVCGEFTEVHTSANYTTSATIDYAQEIDNALADNGLSRANIKTARLVSGEYLVTKFEHDHDWLVSGTIMVERDDISDGPDTLIKYSNISLETKRGMPTAIPLHDDGVALMHRAIDDYLAGDRPRLVMTVTSDGNIVPVPSIADTLKFQWEACLLSHVVVVDTLDVPDP